MSITLAPSFLTLIAAATLIEAVAILEELLTTARRIYGTHHHFPGFMQKDLEAARSKLGFLAERHAVAATTKITS